MTLHVTNGDTAGDTLRLIVNDPVVTAADVLHEGPCPAVDGDAWYEARAGFLSGWAPYDETRAGLAETDRTIAGASRIVMWFEHDLFDQLAIIRTLDYVGRVLADPANVGSAGPAHQPRRVSLICIDRFPGVERFIGLGQLTADQLSTLKGTGAAMTAGHFALASEAWRAFRSADPMGLCHLAQQLTAAQIGGVSEGGAALPFLGDALLRFLAEYPAVENGLSRTETLALQALAAGPMPAARLFGAAQAQEPRRFLGDLPFFDNLDRLATARVPLVTVTGDGERRLRQIAITEAGREVMANRADHVQLNGIELWRGGVHLSGSADSPWRWDAHGETLVS